MILAVARILFFCGLGLLTTLQQGYGESILEDAWQKARQGGHYVMPAQPDLVLAEQLFVRLLQQPRDLESEKDGWRALGFILEKVSWQEGDYILLRENPTMKYGRGFYLFAPNGKNPSLLMIPHAFKDVGTDEIGLQLFLNNDFAAIALNTVPRYSQLQNGEKREHDLGKLPDSLFAALTRAFAAVNPQGKIVQLHGFTQDKRTSEAGIEAGLILSSGSNRIPGHLPVLQRCLQAVFPLKVLIYPKEVQELGGTTNISGKILRLSGHDGFVHIEMDRLVRDRLRRESSLRVSFGNCLEQM